jgi:hypothetical protein
MRHNWDICWPKVAPRFKPEDRKSLMASPETAGGAAWLTNVKRKIAAIRPELSRN